MLAYSFDTSQPVSIHGEHVHGHMDFLINYIQNKSICLPANTETKIGLNTQLGPFVYICECILEECGGQMLEVLTIHES